jgi:hypothetical protein
MTPTTTSLPIQVGGRFLTSAVCVAPTEALAMEVAALVYLQHYAELFRSLHRFNDLVFCPAPSGRNLLVIEDASDVEGVHGWVVFWPAFLLGGPELAKVRMTVFDAFPNRVTFPGQHQSIFDRPASLMF